MRYAPPDGLGALLGGRRPGLSVDYGHRLLFWPCGCYHVHKAGLEALSCIPTGI